MRKVYSAPADILAVVDAVPPALRC